MAILPGNSASSHSHHASSSSFSDLESWAEDAIQSVSTLALSDASLSSPIAAAAPAVLLDVHNVAATAFGASTPHPTAMAGSAAVPDTVRPVERSSVSIHELRLRESLKRRETLEKGREGTRRRQRWENDRLLSNPYFQPPLPKDWEISPTYPVRAVPYYLASLWDTGFAARNAAKKVKAKNGAKSKSGGKASNKISTASGPPTGVVPKELRETLKRARGAKGLLQDLEADVRSFVEAWELRQRRKHDAGGTVTPPNGIDANSEDEEIVFVGRDGAMNDVPASPGAREMLTEIDMEEVEEELQRCKKICDGLVDDKSAKFGRWLVHSIANYYGLSTWSVTVGDPARREAYVGITEPRLKTGRVGPRRQQITLPRPLWGMV